MADVEAALLEFFDDLAYTVTSTPLDLEQRLRNGERVLRVRRIGGAGDRDNDFPRVSLQHYAVASSAAPRAHFDFAEDTEDRLLDLADTGPLFVAGACLDEAKKDSGPVELPYPNDSVRVTETIYRLTIRR